MAVQRKAGKHIRRMQLGLWKIFCDFQHPEGFAGVKFTMKLFTILALAGYISIVAASPAVTAVPDSPQCSSPGGPCTIDSDCCGGGVCIGLGGKDVSFLFLFHKYCMHRVMIDWTVEFHLPYTIVLLRPVKHWLPATNRESHRQSRWRLDYRGGTDTWDVAI